MLIDLYEYYMLEKMIVIIPAYFLILTYHRRLVIAGWSALLLNLVFFFHELYYLITSEAVKTAPNSDHRDDETDRDSDTYSEPRWIAAG